VLAGNFSQQAKAFDTWLMILIDSCWHARQAFVLSACTQCDATSATTRREQLRVALRRRQHCRDKAGCRAWGETRVRYQPHVGMVVAESITSHSHRMRVGRNGPPMTPPVLPQAASPSVLPPPSTPLTRPLKTPPTTPQAAEAHAHTAFARSYARSFHVSAPQPKVRRVWGAEDAYAYAWSPHTLRESVEEFEVLRTASPITLSPASPVPRRRLFESSPA